MSGKKRYMLIIITAALILALSGCIQLEKTGPDNPDVSLFELFVSDTGKTRLDEPEFARGDTVYFTLEYQQAENFKPLVVSNIQYDFSRLRPVGMDVHQGFPVDDLVFLDDSGSPADSVTLNPGESVLISLAIPQTREKWDDIIAEPGVNQSVGFNLVIKIQDLVVPLQSNELTVTV